MSPSLGLALERHRDLRELSQSRVPVKVVSERLGHGNPAFTIDTYQHVLPGMQAEAAGVFKKLIVPEGYAGQRMLPSTRLCQVVGLQSGFRHRGNNVTLTLESQPLSVGVARSIAERSSVHLVMPLAVIPF